MAYRPTVYRTGARTKIEVFLSLHCLAGCLSVQQLLPTKYTKLPTISIYLWNFLERRKRSRWREGTAKIYFECVLLSGFLLVSLEFRTLGKLLASISKIIVFYKVYKITNHLNTSLKHSIKRKQMKRGSSELYFGCIFLSGFVLVSFRRLPVQ